MTASSLLDRAFICLEDGEFEKADDLLEKVLNLNPKNVQAYIGKLMARKKLHNEKELDNLLEPISDFPDFRRAIQFADDDYRSILKGYDFSVEKNHNEKKREKVYQEEILIKQYAISYGNFPSGSTAAEKFRFISGYKDADLQAEECDRLTEQMRVKEKKTNKNLLIAIVVLVILFIVIFVIVSLVL